MRERIKYMDLSLILLKIINFFIQYIHNIFTFKRKKSQKHKMKKFWKSILFNDIGEI